MSATSCWVTTSGQGPTVVLVHGAMDRSSSFARVTRQLEGWHVVRYDRRGYGHSTALGPATSMAQQIADLVQVIEDHSDGPAVVVGHSYGGTVAAAAAATRPDLVRALVAYEAPMPWRDWWPATSAGAAAVAETNDPGDAAEAFMRRMIGADRWRRLPPSTKAARRAEGPALVAEIELMRPPYPPVYDPADLAMPVVAAHGSEGRDHHRAAARTLAAEAPLGQLVVLDGAGHGAHLSHADRFAGLVTPFAQDARS